MESKTKNKKIALSPAKLAANSSQRPTDSRISHVRTQTTRPDTSDLHARTQTKQPNQPDLQVRNRP
jgi:hypothetical protein